MRVWLAVSLAIAGLQAGCGKTKTLPCTVPIDQYCSLVWGGCLRTWDGGQLDPAICADMTPLRIQCGPYLALTFPSVDSSQTYYYDAASGMLVAIVVASAVEGSTCAAGPADGFTLPTCAGASEPLPECLDGGADGAAD